MWRATATLATAIWLTGCSVFGVRSEYEQASYAVIEVIADNVEVRRYRSLLVAETVATAADEKSARNQAFRKLFDYISGANRPRAKIAMTTPVETAADSARIAMTVPVETAPESAGRYVMRFMLPAETTAETVPEPTDPEVRIREQPERTLAVLRFSGSTGRENLASHREELLGIVAASGWRPAGEPVAMYYDPPWTIPFLRRNEVALPVSRD
jgi:hypothetical protein